MNNSRRKLLKLGVAGGAAGITALTLGQKLAAQAEVSRIMDSSKDPVFSSKTIQFPSAASDPSPLIPDYLTWFNTSESVHGRLKFTQGGVAYDVLNNIVNADIAASAAIANSKVVGNANLGANVFSAYPLVNQTDFLAPWGVYDYYVHVITGSPNQYQVYDRVGNKFGSQSADAAAVINAAINQQVVTNNKNLRMWFEDGIYNINTLTQDTNAGNTAYRFSNGGTIPFYYGIGLPNGTNPVDITLEGSTQPDIWYHDAGGNEPVPLLGVIFNMTTTAMNTIASGANVAILHHVMPDTTNTNFGNSVHLKRLRCRFPSNLIASYTGHVPAGLINFDMEFCIDEEREWCISDFNIVNTSLTPATIGAGAPGIGFADMQREHHLTTLTRCQAAGNYIAFNYEGEAIYSRQDIANFCVYPFWMNKNYTNLSFENHISDFYEFECQNGGVFGLNAGNASVRMESYTLEYNTNVTWTRSNGATEQTPGQWQGYIRYKPISAGGYLFTEFFKAANGGFVDCKDIQRSPANVVHSQSPFTMNRSNTFLSCDCTAGVITVNLPSCASVGEQGTFVIVKIDSSANAVTVARSGSDTIQGSASSKTLSSQYSKIVLQSRGTTDWYDLSIGGV